MATIRLDEKKKKGAHEAEDNTQQDIDLQQREQFDSFMRLLSMIYEQRQKDCSWKFKDVTKPNGRSIKSNKWIDKAVVFADVPRIGDLGERVFADIKLPGNLTVKNLEIAKKSVTADLGRFCEDAEELSLNALGMALTAAASKNMRTKGVTISADTPEESAALYLACQFVGLSVARPPEVAPEIMQKAQQNMAQAWGKLSAAADGKFDFEKEAQAKAAERQKSEAEAPDADDSREPETDESGQHTAPEQDTATDEDEGQQAAPVTNQADNFPHIGDDDGFMSDPIEIKATQGGMGFVKEDIDPELGLMTGIRVPSENVTWMDSDSYGKVRGATSQKTAPKHAGHPTAENAETALPDNIKKAAAALADKMQKNQGETSPIAPDNDTENTVVKERPAPLVLDENMRTDLPEEDIATGIESDENAPQETTTPSHISAPFNESVLPEEIATKLGYLNIDQDLYKRIRNTVIQTQDARRNTLKNAFKDEGLRTSQITAVVETLDQEGITSPQDRPGASRRVNFEPDGTPKSPAVA